MFILFMYKIFISALQDSDKLLFKMGGLSI